MSTSSTSTSDPWSELSRSERIALGKALVAQRLESVGCAVRAPSSLIDGKLDVRTASGRSIEVFVSTQRVGGYVFWTKRRLQPARTRFAAIVLLAEAEDPDLCALQRYRWHEQSARDYLR